MEIITDYVNAIQDKKARGIFSSVLDWVAEHYPQLDASVFWGAAAFTHHGTFIISYSASKDNLMVSPEYKALKRFGERFDKAGLKWSKMIVRFPWKKEIDYGLLQDIIDYNIKDKQGMTTYWRPKETWQ